jgi:hypothetical protein
MSLVERFSDSEEQITSCIDRGLDRVGPNVKYLVYWHLQKIGHIKRADIASNPEKFASGLRGLYRESASAVERAIIQELNAAFELNVPQTQLVNAIVESRQKVERAKAV